MRALETISPVFFMILLGLLARTRGWLTAEQNDGVKQFIVKVLRPIMIFNSIFTAKLSLSTLTTILYVIAGFGAAYEIGRLLKNWVGKEYAEISPFLLMTCEGSCLALPLYLSLVGETYIINIVTFNLAGSFIVSLVVPIVVARKTARSAHAREMWGTLSKNSLLLAVVLGLLANLAGAYQLVQQSAFSVLYANLASMAISPIKGAILFTLGYDLKVDVSLLRPVLRLAAVRIGTSALLVAGFFFLFPELMADKIYRAAVMIDFFSSVSFAMPLQLEPLCSREGSETQFMSVFVSLYIVITLLVYSLTALML